MSLLDLTIKTIIKERLPFPKLVYLSVKHSLVKIIIKYDRVDILQCINYDIHFRYIKKLVPKMYHWNSIQCFSYLNLHTGSGLYLLASDYFDHKRIIRGYLPVNKCFTLTKEESYIILLRSNIIFIRQLIELNIVFMFNWPLTITSEIAALVFNNNACKKVAHWKLCKFINRCVSIETKRFLLKKCKTVNWLLNFPSLLIKLELEKIKEKQFISCVNRHDMSVLITPDDVVRMQKYINIFKIRWPKSVDFYKSKTFSLLLNLDEWAYTSKAYSKIIRYVRSGHMSPDYLEPCLLRGCSIMGMYTHLTVDMIDIYVKYGGKLLNALKRLNTTPQQVYPLIKCKFECEKDKLEAIAYYCKQGDLNTIEYIVSHS